MDYISVKDFFHELFWFIVFLLIVDAIFLDSKFINAITYRGNSEKDKEIAKLKNDIKEANENIKNLKENIKNNFNIKND